MNFCIQKNLSSAYSCHQDCYFVCISLQKSIVLFSRLYFLKKIITISFLLILFITQLGYHFIMEFSREVYKENLIKTILPGLKKIDLTKIETNNPSINWVEDNKEFTLGNVMYDVVKAKSENGKTYFYCLADTQEEELIKKHNQLTKDAASPYSEGKNGKQCSSVISFSDYIVTEDICIYATATTVLKTNYSIDKHTKQAFASIDIQSPPPRV